MAVCFEFRNFFGSQKHVSITRRGMIRMFGGRFVVLMEWCNFGIAEAGMVQWQMFDKESERGHF